MAKIPECVIVELLVVVRDEYPGDPEVANDAFLDKALDIFLRDSMVLLRLIW